MEYHVRIVKTTGKKTEVVRHNKIATDAENIWFMLDEYYGGLFDNNATQINILPCRSTDCRTCNARGEKRYKEVS